jgi:hypothetical protein
MTVRGDSIPLPMTIPITTDLLQRLADLGDVDVVQLDPDQHRDSSVAGVAQLRRVQREHNTQFIRFNFTTARLSSATITI